MIGTVICVDDPEMLACALAADRGGSGKSIKFVEQGASTWQTEAIQERFRRSLPEQWNAAYAQAVVPSDARPADRLRAESGLVN